jgi:hypothetical protein
LRLVSDVRRVAPGDPRHRSPSLGVGAMSVLRVPPYAGDIAQARRRGLVPARGEVWICCDFWANPAPGREIVVVPPGEAPQGFAWWWLADLSVIIWWRSCVTPPERLDALAQAILTVNPVRLHAIDRDTNGIRFFKTAGRGIESQVAA